MEDNWMEEERRGEKERSKEKRGEEERRVQIFGDDVMIKTLAY